MATDSHGAQRHTTVLFPPPGIVQACTADVIASFSVFRGDRKLRVGDHSVTVGTEALASRSEYFACMFKGSFKESGEGEEVLVGVPDESSFFHVLYFLMTGTMRDLTVENFSGIVANASFVQSRPLLDYLQQVALAYHKKLFEDASFQFPTVPAEFVKGFLGKAKDAQRVRSFYEAAYLVGCWMNSDLGQAASVLGEVRQLFPLPPRKLPPLQVGKGNGKRSATEAGLDSERAHKAARRQAPKSHAERVAEHEASWHRISYDFVKAVKAHPPLLNVFTAKDALLALDPVLKKDHTSAYVLHSLGQKQREAAEKLGRKTQSTLSELLQSLHGPLQGAGHSASVLAGIPPHSAQVPAWRVAMDMEERYRNFADPSRTYGPPDDERFFDDLFGEGSGSDYDPGGFGGGGSDYDL